VLVMPIKFNPRHLARPQHIELARLLNQAQDNLVAATKIVCISNYTDQTLTICRAIQERLIDTLSIDGWPRATKSAGKPGDQSPYQSVAYLGGPKRLLPNKPRRPS
jgi:hypothetical protein